MSLRLCNCCGFADVDPSDAVPRDRDVLLHYVRHGPIQPTSGFVRNSDGRSFRAEWFANFPWLEYSLSRHSAYCFYCRLFALECASTTSGGQVDTAFSSSGFNHWKKALEKGRGFRKHNECRSHAFAEQAYRSFLNEKPVDAQLSMEKERSLAKRQELIRRNRGIIERLFDVARFLSRLSLPFRGHDESECSSNRGVFLELVTYLANSGDDILNNHLQQAAGNATYMAPTTQNEMIGIIGEAVQENIVGRVKAAGVFSVLMDETTDVSHQEQVAIFTRFVNDGGDVEERLLAIVSTAATTGWILICFSFYVLRDFVSLITHMPQKLQGWDYCTVKNCIIFTNFLTDQPVWQMDAQSKGRTDGR